MERDRIIVEKVLNGDPQAFSALVETYQKRLFSFLYKMTLSREDADTSSTVQINRVSQYDYEQNKEVPAKMDAEKYLLAESPNSTWFFFNIRGPVPDRAIIRYRSGRSGEITEVMETTVESQLRSPALPKGEICTGYTFPDNWSGDIQFEFYFQGEKLTTSERIPVISEKLARGG